MFFFSVKINILFTSPSLLKIGSLVLLAFLFQHYWCHFARQYVTYPMCKERLMSRTPPTCFAKCSHYNFWCRLYLPCLNDIFWCSVLIIIETQVGGDQLYSPACLGFLTLIWILERLILSIYYLHICPGRLAGPGGGGSLRRLKIKI